MDKIIIFGMSNHSHMIRELIEKEKAAEVVAYTLNSKYINNSTQYKGYPIVPFEQIENYFPNNQYKILNTIGYTKMNELRNEKNKECLEKGYELYNFISKNAILLSNVGGQGNIILPGAYIGTNVIIGDSNVIYTACVLTHDIVLRNNSFLAAGSTIGGSVIIGNNCFLGMNCTIKNSINIADYSLIGASSYISSDTEKYGVYVPEKSKKLDKISINII